VKAPPVLASTALTLEVPRGPALPFVEGAAPPVIAAPSATPTQPAALGGTSLSVEVPRGPALPFAAPSPKAQLAETSTFELSEHLRALKPPAAPPLPSFTIEQYASLCLDLVAAPSLAAETLARYRITAAERERLARHFQERFARDPAEREVWERARATYRAWLASQRGR
jgi:hypothetical protein